MPNAKNLLSAHACLAGTNGRTKADKRTDQSRQTDGNAIIKVDELVSHLKEKNVGDISYPHFAFGCNVQK